MGSFTCDFDSSYFNTDTINQPGEIYRQWVPLVNQVDSRQSGIMGHLKLSIRFVGPGDVPIPHNLPEELKQEKLAIAKGEPLPVLFPADVKPTLNFLVFSVYRAQGLPPMDSTMALSSMAKSFALAAHPQPQVRFEILRRTGISNGRSKHTIPSIAAGCPAICAAGASATSD